VIQWLCVLHPEQPSQPQPQDEPARFFLINPTTTHVTMPSSAAPMMIVDRLSDINVIM